MLMVIPGEIGAQIGAVSAAALLDASRKDRRRPAAAVRG